MTRRMNRTVELSYWLKDAIASEAPPDPLILTRNINADICIVGGGFTGLWSAIEIKTAKPSCEVVVVERDLCGSGASGRNGGFVLSLWAKFATLAKMCGEEEAIRLCNESSQAILDLQRFCEGNSLDAEFRLDGWLWAATSRPQIGTWDPTLETLDRLRQQPFTRLSAREAQTLGGSKAHLAGVFERVSASVQPAKLARGLKQHAERLGVKIYERSPMTRLDRGAPAKVHCEQGAVKARKVILALNAWAAAFSEIRKSIVVVSSDVVVTRPLPRLLESIRWTSGMTISDCRMLVHYYRTTPDGRIVFGKGGGSGVMAFGAKVNDHFDGPSPIAATVYDFLSRTYPQITEKDVQQSWTGPIDRSSNGLPLFGSLPYDKHIYYGVGYSGNGVGPSMLGGKILGSLALELDNHWAHCGLVQPLRRAFPPEPFRYFGGQLVRRAVMQSDRAADEGRSAGRLVCALTKLAPAGLSPTRQPGELASGMPS